MNEDIITTKLDILIKDFQRFRDEQVKENRKRIEHSAVEDKVQASIVTTLKWHTIVGSFMMGIVMFLVYKGS